MDRRHALDFYGRAIYAATAGKLVITEPGHIESLAGARQSCREFTSAQQLSCARQEAVDTARSAGFDRAMLHRVASCVGEMLSNALKHAGGGTSCIHANDGHLMFVVSDTGPGIDPVDLPGVALVTGYSTAGSGGLGYRLILESADRVYLATDESGTTVAAELGASGSG